MANRYQAKLGDYDLPPTFSYKPYVPRKRKTVTATANGVVTQYAETPIIHGDGTIAWSMPGSFASEMQAMYNLYQVTETLVFLGYWGEEFVVSFDDFDQPSVRGRLFDLSGQFQVRSVTTHQNATCSIPSS